MRPVIVMVMLFASWAMAQTPNAPSTPNTPNATSTPSTPDAIEAPTLGASAQSRQKMKTLFTLNFSPIDMLVPGKKGVSVGMGDHDGRIYELEYLSAKFAPLLVSDLGAINDQRISVMMRSFSGRNSFNYFCGLSYLATNLEFGSSLANKVTGLYPYMEAFEVQSIGLQFGVGSEWIFERGYFFPIRIDWIAITQPVYTLKHDAPILDYVNDQTTRNSLDTAISIAQWTPRISIVKIQAGFAL